eukprot:812558-Amphidinium_carterae.1
MWSAKWRGLARKQGAMIASLSRRKAGRRPSGVHGKMKIVTLMLGNVASEPFEQKGSSSFYHDVVLPGAARY